MQASNSLPCLRPTPREKEALCSGGQISPALALAGVFEAERVLPSALVASALSHDATRGSADGLKARLPRRHQAGNDVAATLGALLARAQIRPARAGSSSAEPPSSLDAQVELVGACLDLLCAAGETLTEEANTVADDTLVVWQTGELVACGPSTGAPVAVAADLVALALGHLAAQSERRIGTLLDPSLPRRMRKSARNSGLAALHATAATLAAETRERARPASFASSDGAQLPAVPGAQRLLPMAGNVTLILAVELMAAVEAFELGGRKRSSDALEPVRALIRARAAAGQGCAARAGPCCCRRPDPLRCARARGERRAPLRWKLRRSLANAPTRPDSPPTSDMRHAHCRSRTIVLWGPTPPGTGTSVPP